MMALRDPKSGGSASVPYALSLLSSEQDVGASHYMMADVNGDGLLDAIEVPNAGGNVRIAINTGRDFMPPIVDNLPTNDKLPSSVWIDGNGGVQSTNVAPRVMDFDQDGRSDLILMDSGCNSSGTVRSSPVVLQAGPGPNLTPVPLTGVPIGRPTACAGAGISTVRVLDVNGDGLSDLVQLENQSGSQAEIVLYVRHGVKPNLLQTITNGIGNKTSVEYKPITDPTVHTPATCSYPQYCTPHGSTWVVSRHSIAADAGDPDKPNPLLSYSHTYQGSRTDLQGLVGLEWISTPRRTRKQDSR